MDIAVEFTTLSKTYAMPGWRIGFAVGNERLIDALTRVKSYLDYGAFTPIQVAAAAALNGPQDCIDDIRAIYRRRRDCLVDALTRAGWPIPSPPATMFAWAPIPDMFAHLGSLEFSKLLLEKAGVAVSPGVGFGEYGEGHVRIALVENEQRIRQAARNIRKFLAQTPPKHCTTSSPLPPRRTGRSDLFPCVMDLSSDWPVSAPSGAASCGFSSVRGSELAARAGRAIEVVAVSATRPAQEPRCRHFGHSVVRGRSGRARQGAVDRRVRRVDRRRRRRRQGGGRSRAARRQARRHRQQGAARPAWSGACRSCREERRRAQFRGARWPAAFPSSR